MRRIIRTAILSFLSLVIVSSLVFAATWEYKFPVTVQDVSGATRTQYPVLMGYTGQTFIDSGKINANGLDTNMQIRHKPL